MRTRHLIYNHDCLKTPGSRLNDRLKNLPQGRVLIGQIDPWKLHKLDRGVAKAEICRLEIPRQVGIKWEKSHPATGLILDFVNGVVRVFARLTAGFYETATHAFTTPLSRQMNLEPDFVLTAAMRAPMPEQSAMGGKQAGRFKH